jgi:hypothetical protein
VRKKLLFPNCFEDASSFLSLFEKLAREPVFEVPPSLKNEPKTKIIKF